MFRQGDTTYINAHLDYFLPKNYNMVFAFYQNGNRLLYQALLNDPQSPLKRLDEKNDAYFTCTLPPNVTKNFVGNIELHVVIFNSDQSDQITAEQHVDLYFKPTVFQTQKSR